MENNKNWETSVFEENSFTLRAFFLPYLEAAAGGGGDEEQMVYDTITILNTDGDGNISVRALSARTSCSVTSRSKPLKQINPCHFPSLPAQIRLNNFYWFDCCSCEVYLTSLVTLGCSKWRENEFVGSVSNDLRSKPLLVW
eukprot:4483923-Amphidinium_carterae.1